MPLPPRDVFAAAARRAVEELHTEWDALHSFQILWWDGKNLECRTYVAIDPAIGPGNYQALMIRIAREQVEKYPGDPPYAYLLQVESVGKPEMPEAAIAWCVDIHGRAWCASKFRDTGHIEEKYAPPGTVPHGARMIDGLFAVAQATGVTAHGLPMPLGERSN
jgi:hypothetical protein